jgi:hypothetical protein
VGKIVLLQRYIHTELADVTLKIFRRRMLSLEYNEDDGTKIERTYYVIIPMALANGLSGIATGFPHASHASILSTFWTTLEDSPYLKIFNPCLPSTEDSREDY